MRAILWSAFVASLAVASVQTSKSALNVLDEPLQLCCEQPRTGFYRDGFCHTGDADVGTHVVCAHVTTEFLLFSRSRGNDLMTPRSYFPGLNEGDCWCLCAGRWAEALAAGAAPPVNIAATHKKALKFVERETLEAHAVAQRLAEEEASHKDL